MSVNARADLSNDRFGKINIYRSSAEPKGAVILFSSDSGFDSETEALANQIAQNGLLVIGVNTPRYISGIANEDHDEDCSYLAGEITRLSQAVQSTEKLKVYKKPLLMGIQSGASLAYAIAAQYPPEFTGLVSIGFCPQLTTTPLLCDGEGLKSAHENKIQILKPDSVMPVAWRDFDSAGLFNCSNKDISKFFSKDKEQTLISLPKEADKVSVAAPWIQQLYKALSDLSEDQDEADDSLEEAVSDLPLIELFPEKRLHNSLMLIISGDGGWATIDKELGEYFQNQGYAVLGFNALRYFWQKKTPDQVADDINRAIRFYRTKLGVEDISLVGFSFGADILPFVVNRLSKDNKKDISSVTFLSPGKTTDFEIHVADWLGIDNVESAYSVADEIDKIIKSKILCIYGQDDEDQTCTSLKNQTIKTIVLPGDHHFDGDYEKVAKLIVDADSKK